jgi:hypothetical protein
LNQRGEISRIVNNYEHMSFNFGPTLLLWLKEADPATYALILEADRQAAERHGGHGPAMAQVFNHAIMPLANARDKRTQALWGRRYFELTFRRPPEGMWLAETAACSESLAAISRAGAKFTVLAQNQIQALRELSPEGGRGASAWSPPSQGVDPREPYRIFWGEGQKDFIDVFVYDGPLSRAVAFERLLRDGRAFLDRIGQAFGQSGPGENLLVNLATDGESYGHHFRFGEMALAWIFHTLDSQPEGDPGGIRLTNYGEYLSLCPPRLEARLVENSSWSCCHGVERWRSDCGCRAGGEEGWNQKWRAPLRDGLNQLRDSLSDIFQKEGQAYFKDPWAARDDFLDVLASGYQAGARQEFLKRHGRKAPDLMTARETAEALELMESQLMSLYMFTSCAWFFDDIAGLEPVQNLRYAARAIEICQGRSPRDLTADLLGHLKKAIPNDKSLSDGAAVWNEMVVPAILPPALAAAHLAAARVASTPQALSEFRYLAYREDQTQEAAPEGRSPHKGAVLPRLLTAKATLTDSRLGLAETKHLLALAEEGPRLDILIFGEDNPDFGPARAMFREGHLQELREGLCRLYPEAFRHSLDTLWPSVRQAILSEFLRDFFSDLKSHAQREAQNCRDALRQYGQTEGERDWASDFVFRVLAEAELESLARPMREGRSFDLSALAEKLSGGPGSSAQEQPILGQAATAYLSKLLGQLKDGPDRGGLLDDLLAFLAAVRDKAGCLDLWEPQNLWHSLAISRSYRSSLSAREGEIFWKIGQALGFAEECPSWQGNREGHNREE